ncbi:hypothetical protein BT96DRAFT_43325 [Gymnopus androsaceus JB14]|uniref:Uncharacterized protein n=1 Tax=Gymnopus androsaceus JB14 TaxID=1447944 RepID=A0A6A4HKE0_9AGAR|nr:hypothetical protein BT96DRAFT_43325 [Gymnopus androsaceus JB14]
MYTISQYMSYFIVSSRILVRELLLVGVSTITTLTLLYFSSDLGELDVLVCVCVIAFHWVGLGLTCSLS